MNVPTMNLRCSARQAAQSVSITLRAQFDPRGLDAAHLIDIELPFRQEDGQAGQIGQSAKHLAQPIAHDIPHFRVFEGDGFEALGHVNFGRLQITRDAVPPGCGRDLAIVSAKTLGLVSLGAGFSVLIAEIVHRQVVENLIPRASLCSSNMSRLMPNSAARSRSLIACWSMVHQPRIGRGLLSGTEGRVCAKAHEQNKATTRTTRVRESMLTRFSRTDI